jgi:hypothetical protein
LFKGKPLVVVILEVKVGIAEIRYTVREEPACEYRRLV